jgi:putative intracellular protease/amidase
MRVLFVLTSAARAGRNGVPTGFDREDFAALYYGLLELNAEIVLATPAGGSAPAAPDRRETAVLARLKADARARAELADTLRLDQVFAGDFDAAVFPGGEGARLDLVADAAAGAVVRELLARGAPVAWVGDPPADLAALDAPSMIAAAQVDQVLTRLIAALAPNGRG